MGVFKTLAKNKRFFPLAEIFELISADSRKKKKLLNSKLSKIIDCISFDVIIFVVVTYATSDSLKIIIFV